MKEIDIVNFVSNIYLIIVFAREISDNGFEGLVENT